MRIKLDENIPPLLAPALRAFGHDVHTVEQEGLAGQSDARVWRAAQTEGRFFITQDLDFSDLRQYPPGAHHGLLLVRLGKGPVAAVLAQVCSLLSGETAPMFPRANVVLKPGRHRIHLPPGGTAASR